ncbi:MAG: hypothetical protein QXG12_07950 [Thermoproteota archaeon]
MGRKEKREEELYRERLKRAVLTILHNNREGMGWNELRKQVSLLGIRLSKETFIRRINEMLESGLIEISGEKRRGKKSLLRITGKGKEELQLVLFKNAYDKDLDKIILFQETYDRRLGKPVPEQVSLPYDASIGLGEDYMALPWERFKAFVSVLKPRPGEKERKLMLTLLFPDELNEAFSKMTLEEQERAVAALAHRVILLANQQILLYGKSEYFETIATWIPDVNREEEVNYFFSGALPRELSMHLKQLERKGVLKDGGELINNFLYDLVRSTIEKIAETLEQVPSDVTPKLVVLINLGWAYDPESKKTVMLDMRPLYSDNQSTLSLVTETPNAPFHISDFLVLQLQLRDSRLNNNFMNLSMEERKGILELLPSIINCLADTNKNVSRSLLFESNALQEAGLLISLSAESSRKFTILEKQDKALIRNIVVWFFENLTSFLNDSERIENLKKLVEDGMLRSPESLFLHVFASCFDRIDRLASWLNNLKGRTFAENELLAKPTVTVDYYDPAEKMFTSPLTRTGLPRVFEKGEPNLSDIKKLVEERVKELEKELERWRKLLRVLEEEQNKSVTT